MARRFFDNLLFFFIGAMSIFFVQNFLYDNHYAHLKHREMTRAAQIPSQVQESVQRMTQEHLSSSKSSSPEVDNGKTKVYHYNGKEILRLHEFCSWPTDFRCVMLNTSGSGVTPIHVHDLSVDTWVSRDIVEHGTWEGANIRLVLEELKKDQELGFIDIGSHVGVFSLSVAKFGRKVVSIDPLIENVQRLCKSIQKGGFTDLMTIIFNPVSDDHKMVGFKRSKNNVGGTSIFTTSGQQDTKKTCTESNNSPTVMLDDIIDLIPFRKAVLKMDVQEHELYVLKGAKKFFETISVTAIMMEWDGLKKGSLAEPVMTLLHSYKFKAYEPKQNGKELDPKNFRKWPYDIFWKKSP